MKRLFVLAVALLLTTSTALAQGSNGHGRDPHSFRVVDRDSKLVGHIVSDNIVAREVDDGLWVQFYVHPALGIFDSLAMYVYFTSADCTGAQYVPRYRVFLEGVRVGARLYYPTDCVELAPASVQILASLDGYDTTCRTIPPSERAPYVFGRASSIDLEALGLSLPFRAVQ